LAWAEVELVLVLVLGCYLARICLGDEGVFFSFISFLSISFLEFVRIYVGSSVSCGGIGSGCKQTLSTATKRGRRIRSFHTLPPLDLIPLGVFVSSIVLFCVLICLLSSSSW
jgi:hypothetical protein